MDKDKLINSLMLHEGIKLKPYKDTKGILTIGIGRNLEDRGIFKNEAMLMLNNDIELFKQQLVNQYPWFGALGDIRQNVMIEMMFILGPARFALFKNMIHYMAIKDYKNAAQEIKNSKFANDVGETRANFLCNTLETGDDLS